MANTPKDTQVKTEEEKWDELLDSEEGLDTFAALMNEAKQDIEKGSFDEDKED